MLRCALWGLEGLNKNYLPISGQIQLRGRRPWALGLLQALTSSGKKSLNILWNPDMIPGDECFAFETKASALWSPTEKGARRAVVKPTRATSLTSKPGLGWAFGRSERGPPSSRLLPELGLVMWGFTQGPRLLWNRGTSLGCSPSSPSLLAPPRSLPGCTARPERSRPAPGPPPASDQGQQAGDHGPNAARTCRAPGPFWGGRLRRQAPAEQAQPGAGRAGPQPPQEAACRPAPWAWGLPRKCNNIYDLAMRKCSPSMRSTSFPSPGSFPPL